MHKFCTLFDSNYLSRGVALYNSLLASGEEFKLYVFCFDEMSHRALKGMKLEKAIPVSLAELETADLKRIKKERSAGEYCWTCTPHVIGYALETFSLPEITYLDADLYFFDGPSVLLREFTESGASVLLTEHRYSPEYDQSAESGIYCVQFITFRSDERGMTALRWWRDRCLEWCYARVEDGKFGDQKYLDDWRERFDGVHVLGNPGGGVAPWNVQQYRIAEHGGRIMADAGPLVFYHFHNYRRYENGDHDLGHYRLSREVIDLLYRPYVKALERAEDQIFEVCPDYRRPRSRRVRKWSSPFWNLVYRIKGTYNVHESL